MLIIAVAWLFGRLARGAGQPPGVGEIAAGLLLGPSVLGAVWPGGFAAMFPSEAQQSLQLLGKIGLILLQIAGVTALFLVLTRLVGPWLIAVWRQPRHSDGSARMPIGFLALLLVALFGAALIANLPGVFSIFGAFLLGVSLHEARCLVRAWRETFADFVLVALVPIFFTHTRLQREVVLELENSRRPVEYGAICIHLQHLPEEARRIVLEERHPFGRILQAAAIAHLSWPQAFFSVRSDVHMSRLLGARDPALLYGRRNVLVDGHRRLLANVVEIVAPVPEPLSHAHENQAS